jgi:hypothetical protein
MTRLTGLSVPLFCAGLAFSIQCGLPANAAPIEEPGGTADATALALSNPAEYAWSLFFFLNRQAKPDTAGQADETKDFGKLDPGASVVWETWAMASGGAASEVYRPDGSQPVGWEQLKRGGPRALVLDQNLEQVGVLGESTRLKPFFFPSAPLDQEVRQNRAMFEFVVGNEMYHRGGLEALYTQAAASQNRSLINFKDASKEVKAQWYPIKDSDKPRYLWREVANPDGTKTVYGLVALHIITKDLPDWFWADFGHVDCETQKGGCDPASVKQYLGFDQEEAKTEPVDPTTRGPGAPSGRNGVRQETIGTIWQNYILRGTQIDFVTAFGAPTVLSSPVIENGFQNSSCMTCHARASVGPRKVGPGGVKAVRLNTLSPGDPTLGAPEPGLFGAGPGQNSVDYLQTDFIWSSPFRAQRKPGT